MQNAGEWDTRAWLVGILGGVVGGSITAWATYPPLKRQLGTALHTATAAGWVSGSAAILSLLVLPGVLSGLARRRSFLWGALPLLLFLAAVDAEEWAENGLHGVAQDFWASLLIVGGCLLVSSGPVSLIRYRRGRAERTREAALAFLAAQREAASMPQEGVWPPPPEHHP